MIFKVLLVIYSLALVYIFLYSLGQLHLVWHFLKSKSARASRVNPPEEWPHVTVQLPVYNEKYVAARLIEKMVRLDYPSKKLEIQVLDDSTDETRRIIDRAVENLLDGVEVKVIRRNDRTGYKAGALDHGLREARGEYIAIFDADFLPREDFLKQTIPFFTPETGVVQTRWGHINKDYSLLTELQAFGLDAHFTVEQSGRSHASSFINFNGTGGVWRRACIEDAGGWSADTLTEDLDLSYRAQLKGWKFRYRQDTVAPAELPVIMPAVKSQQYRWNKGAAETARKHLGKVLTGSISATGKVHAFFHLLNSSVFICLLLAAVLSIPVLIYKHQNPQLEPLFYLGSIFLVGFFAIGLMYWVATREIYGPDAGRQFLRLFPLFLMMSMGLSLHNGIAVLEGLLGRKTAFIRTPKFNILSDEDSWKSNSYLHLRVDGLTLFEGVLSLYFLFGVVWGIVSGEFGLLPFHLMLFIGFLMVFWYSIKPVQSAA